MESWSRINQVTEPPAVMLLGRNRELAPGQWQVGAGAAVWPMNGMFVPVSPQ